MKKHHAFEQIETDRELLREDVERFKDGCAEWRIEYEDGTVRHTTIAGIAYYAYYFDDEATVVPIDG